MALPFPPNDPLYGQSPPKNASELFLGQVAIKGERGLLKISNDWLNPVFRVLPVSEAARLYGTLLMPQVFLSNRALGRLWYLINRDGDNSPCLQEGQIT